MSKYTDDVVALNQLAFCYAHAIDTCDEDLLTRVFTADGSISVYHPGENEPFQVMRGPDELVLIPRTMRPAHRQTMHQMTNHLVDIDGGKATGAVLCTARHLDLEGKQTLNVLIRYEDLYRKNDGQWKMAERQIRFLWDEVHLAGAGAFVGEEPVR